MRILRIPKTFFQDIFFSGKYFMRYIQTQECILDVKQNGLKVNYMNQTYTQ